ncbi:MAG: hypothetical protein KGL39_59895 [Patescibacteria group bacterium]|nr:hypothetical protein [Patescibacteria group bacterium]
MKPEDLINLALKHGAIHGRSPQFPIVPGVSMNEDQFVAVCQKVFEAGERHARFQASIECSKLAQSYRRKYDGKGFVEEMGSLVVLGMAAGAETCCSLVGMPQRAERELDNNRRSLGDSDLG